MRYVVAVARERNFTRAAEQLHVAQQALSQQVRAVGTTSQPGAALPWSSHRPPLRCGAASRS
jgi:hypothetical protein